MTDLARPMNASVPAARTRAVRTIAAGLFGGCALGVIARAWMRLIAEDPAFTWGGTIFIVLGFTIFGLSQSVLAVARRSTTRRWVLVVARVVGTVGLLPLFVGAGGIMLPTVVGGGLAHARQGWRRHTRWIALAVAVVPVLFVAHDLVGSFGWSPHAAAGFVVMLAVYATIVMAARLTFTAHSAGLRVSRRMKVVGLVALGLAVVQFSVGLVLG